MFLSIPLKRFLFPPQTQHPPVQSIPHLPGRRDKACRPAISLHQKAPRIAARGHEIFPKKGMTGLGYPTAEDTTAACMPTAQAATINPNTNFFPKSPSTTTSSGF